MTGSMKSTWMFIFVALIKIKMAAADNNKMKT